jgi:hypothetical protein
LLLRSSTFTSHVTHYVKFSSSSHGINKEISWPIYLLIEMKQERKKQATIGGIEREKELC